MNIRMPAAFIALLLFAYSAAAASAQQTPAPSTSPSTSPAPRKARMTVPPGWVRVPGDSVAKMVFRSPSGLQDIRVAPTGVSAEFTGDKGLQAVRQMASGFGFAHVDVTQSTVCGGAQPAILTVAKDAQGKTMMEQVVVMGTKGGAIITYEIVDGKPDPQAENSLRSVCVP